MKWKHGQIAVVVIIALFIGAGLFSAQPISAQATATATNTATATATATSTPTPIATALPLVSNPEGLYSGVGIGNYGAPTPVTAGSAFQSNVGSIDLYSSTGRNTFHVDPATGDVTAYGSLTLGNSAGVFSGASSMTYTASYTSGATINHGLGITPTGCIPLFISATAITVTAETLTSSTVAFTAPGAAGIPVYVMCGK